MYGSAPGPEMSKIWNAPQIDHADLLAQVQVFHVDDRRPPAPVPLVRAVRDVVARNQIPGGQDRSSV